MNQLIDETRPPSWNKVPLINWILFGEAPTNWQSLSVTTLNFDLRADPGHACEWALWLDSDAVFSNGRVLLENVVNSIVAKHRHPHGGSPVRETPDIVFGSHAAVDSKFEPIVTEADLSFQPPIKGNKTMSSPLWNRNVAKYLEWQQQAIDKLNMGVFLLRKTAWSRQLMDVIYAQTHLIKHPQWEQQSAKTVLSSSSLTSWQDVREHVAFVNPLIINSINSAWRTGHFIYHMPSCACCFPIKNCIRQLKRALDAYNNSVATFS
jgi:hypothetical protein